MGGQADSTKLKCLPQRDCAIGGTALLAETGIILLILYFAIGTSRTTFVHSFSKHHIYFL